MLFRSMDAEDANFVQADLSFADLSHAKVNRTNFSTANMTGANLHGVEERQARFLNTNMKNVRRTDKDLLAAENWVRR